MTLAVNIAQSGSSNVTFRNRIINGAMVIDQRRAGAALSSNAAGSNYTLDRWEAYGEASGKFSAQQNAGSVTPPSGFTNYLGITSLTANTPATGDSYFLRQWIEGFNSADLGFGAAGASTVTLSFWVRSSLTGTFSGVLTNYNQNRAYPYTYTISSANTWEQKSVTIVGDTSGTWLTTNSGGIGVIFNLGCGATRLGTANAWATVSFVYGATGSTNVLGTNGATWYITGVQLEAGTTASPFEYRQFGTELSLCQRYYEKTFSLTTAPAHNTGEFIIWPNAGSLGCGGNTYITIQFNERKRATSATLRLYDPNASHTNSENWWRYWGGCGSGTAVGPNSGISLSATETFISGSLSASTGAANSFNWTAESEL